MLGHFLIVLIIQSQESKSEVSVKEIYLAMRIKTDLNNAVCFEHEHELVILELQLVSF